MISSVKILKFFSYTILFLIFLLSVIKVPETNAPQYTDKFVHVAMYFICASIFCFLKIKHYIIAAICYGIIIEIVQFFLPWRSFDIFDILANGTGAFIFLIFFMSYKKFQLN